jgi:plastocyanin
MRRERASLRGSLVAVAMPAIALALAPATAAAKVHTVVIEKMRFGPAPAGLRVGDTIVWVNRDPVRHTATARDKSFNIDLPPRKSGKVVVRRAGAIAVYCVFHPAMTSKLAVAR